MNTKPASAFTQSTSVQANINSENNGLKASHLSFLANVPGDGLTCSISVNLSEKEDVKNIDSLIQTSFGSEREVDTGGQVAASPSSGRQETMEVSVIEILEFVFYAGLALLALSRCMKWMM
jgi:hypothetical protein